MASTPAIAPSLTVPERPGVEQAGGQGTSRDDFLKLLVAQMSHQDPLQPETGTAFLAQLAQLAQTEQAQNQTALLKQIQGQLAATASGQAVGLVGHEVTARMSSVLLDGQGAPPLQFTLDKPAASATLIIRDSKGNVVRTLRTGPLQGGVQTQMWDGRSDSGAVLPSGGYRFDVGAVDTAGAPVGARPEVKGAVTGVSFESGEPELVIGVGPGAVRVKLGDVALVSK